MNLDLRGGVNSAQENEGGRASGEPLMRENNLDINKDFNGFVPSLFWSLIQSPVKSIEGLQLGFRGRAEGAICTQLVSLGNIFCGVG